MGLGQSGMRNDPSKQHESKYKVLNQDASGSVTFEELPLREEDLEHDDSVHPCPSENVDKPTQVKCDGCLNSNNEDGLEQETSEIRMCFMCEMYLCSECEANHDPDHRCLRESDDNEIGNMFLGLNTEDDLDDEFMKETALISDRILIKHEVDYNDCWITGLCGTHDSRLVICDSGNSCIKITDENKVTRIERYVRFVAEPWDVTEIAVDVDLHSSGSKERTPRPGLFAPENPGYCPGLPGCGHAVSRSTITPRDNVCELENPNNSPDSPTSVSCTNPSTRKFLIGVSFPFEQQIVIIDIGAWPATKYKTIKLDRQCWNVEYFDGKIFALCEENPAQYASLWEVYEMAIDGLQFRAIKTGITGYYPYSAITNGKLYLTDRWKHSVHCIHLTNTDIRSFVEIKGSRTVGISIDEEFNVYVCALDDDKIYKQSPDLKQREGLIGDKSGNLKRPRILCTIGHRFFVSHDLMPLRNYVTLIKRV